MGSYREAYPSERASAYAANLSSSGRRLYSHEALSNLDLLSRNRISSYPDHVAGGIGSLTALRDPVALLRSDLHVGVFPAGLRRGPLPDSLKQDCQALALLSGDLYAGGFAAQLRSGELPGSLVYDALTPSGNDLCGAKTGFKVQGPMLLSQSHRLAMDMYGPSSYSDANALTTRMGLSDYNIRNHLPLPHLETRPEQKPSTVSTGVTYGGKGKRKAPSMDALIKETWELHSLFRASAAASSSHDGSNPNKKRDRKPADVSHDVDPGGRWMEGPCPRESHDEEGITWSTPLKVSSPRKELNEPDNKEEQLAANLQRFACEKVVQLMGNASDDDDDDDESDEESYAYDDDDDDVLDVVMPLSQGSKSREEQAYNLFMEVFEDKELQKLYTEQCHVGKFECLVCSSMPGKPIKRYPGLVSVVMHASKVIKTKKKQEHRGFARAVCALLGWDVCRLPTVPSQTSTPQPRCCIPAEGEVVQI